MSGRASRQGRDRRRASPIRTLGLRCLVAFSSLLLVAGSAGAQETDEAAPVPTETGWPHQKLLRWLFDPVVGLLEPEKTRQDLTFGNFFDRGWDVGWAEPEEGPDQAPRFRLLKIQRAFWEREVRFTGNLTFGADDGASDETEVEAELELPISRRFLIEFEGGAVGINPDNASRKWGGGDLKIIPEVMLMETRDVSLSSGLVVRTPTGGDNVGEGRTALTPYLAFWKDMGHRIGLHTFFGVELPLDGYESGHPDAILQYGVAPSITLTPKDTPLFGNLTAFMEIDGTTDFGTGDDATTVTLLPGMRWAVVRDVWLATGYEFPVTHTDELDGRVWVSLYLDF